MNLQELLVSAARWVVYYASRPPRPLFSAPCLYFSMDRRGLPNSQPHFVSLQEAFTLLPEALLRRANAIRRYPGSIAAILAYALNEDGDLYNDAINQPSSFVVYAYSPKSETPPGFFERRLVTVEDGEPILGPDRQLRFDNRRPAQDHPLLMQAGPPLELPDPMVLH